MIKRFKDINCCKCDKPCKSGKKQMCISCYNKQLIEKKKAKELIKPSVKKEIPKASKKRESENRIYSRLRKVYLELTPICEVCNKNEAGEIHHCNGRGINLNKIETWKAICRPCHLKVHNENIKL